MNSLQFTEEYGVSPNKFMEIYVYRDLRRVCSVNNPEKLLHMAYDLPVVQMAETSPKDYEAIKIFITKIRNNEVEY